MNLFARINSLENTTNTEKQIINFINQDPMEFSRMTTDEIAKRCYVSKASIYRFCQKLGYSGLNEVKLMITVSLTDRLAHEEVEVDFNRPFHKEDTDFSVLATIRKLYEETIYYSSTHLDMKELYYSTQELKKHKNILIFIDEKNYSVAEIFKNRMRMLGANIEIPDNDFMKLSVAQFSSSEDIVIYGTDNPKLTMHQEFFKTFAGNNTKTILISPSNDENIVRKATYNLIMNTGEKPMPTIANFSSNLAFSFIFDVIYSLYFKKDYDLNLENMKILYMKQKMTE